MTEKEKTKKFKFIGKVPLDTLFGPAGPGDVVDIAESKWEFVNPSTWIEVKPSKGKQE